MIALSTRSLCDICGQPASVTADPDIFLCAGCAEFDPDSEAPESNPVAKETEGNTAKSDDVPKSDRVLSRRAIPRSVATTSENLDATGGESAAINSELACRSLDFGSLWLRASARPARSLGTRGKKDQASNSGDVLGNHKPGSITSGERAALTAGSGRAHNCATCPDVTGTPSPPVHLSEWPTAPATSGGVRSPLASPPFSSNTPEASGTARKASSDPLLGGSSRNDSSRLVSSSDAPEAPRPKVSQATVAGSLQRAPAAVSASKLDFETEVAALEAEWLARGICMNATTFFIAAASDIAEKSKSVSVGA